MKILEINKFYFPKRGAEKHFLDLIQLLKSNGHQVAIFAMQHPQNLKTRWNKYFLSTVGYTNEYSFKERLKGIGRGFYSWEAKKKINQLLDEFQPDIVHIHNIYHQLSPIILFEIKKRGIPILMTVHDFKLISPNYNLYHQGKLYVRGKNKKYYQCFLDRCFKNSYLQSFGAMLEMYWHGKILKTYEKNIDLFLVPSAFVKNILAEWNFKGKHIQVLPHFILENKPTQTVSKKSTKFKVALYAGEVSQIKGVENLVDIFKNQPNFKLYLAGNIKAGIEIHRQKNIQYLGFLNPVMLNQYIAQAIVIISGSKLPETFGLIALEAIAQGKPFVGFRNGAYSEIIQNYQNGFLAKDNQEMKEFIQKISQGKIQFNEDKIYQKAWKKFGSKKYLVEFEAILKKLILHKNSTTIK